MSLRNFTDEIRRRQLRVESDGFSVPAIYVSPEGEKVIIAGAMKEPSDCVKLPELEVYGIPVKVHPKMPAGMFWYVFNGGKAA